MILLNPPLLLHYLELISNFVLSESCLSGLIFDIPLVPLIHGAVECFIFEGRTTNQAMMMIVHGSNILVDQSILSIMMMMRVSAQLTRTGFSYRAVPLRQHHYFVVFLTHQRWWRCHTDIHQRLLQSNAWAFKLGEVTATDRVQTVQLSVVVGTVLMEITETVLVVTVVFGCRVLLLIVLIIRGM